MTRFSLPNSTDQKRNIALTAELNAFIRGQVASGKYQNASELDRTSPRLLHRQEQRGRRMQATSGAGPIDAR